MLCQRTTTKASSKRQSCPRVPKKQATAQQAEAVVDALMKERSRLEPQPRREQLLDAGAALFAEKPYEDVFVEDIAARAGVSRALLYHYYPSKRDLYVAIFKRASTRLLARANPDPQLPLAYQLATGLEAHIQYFADHPFEAVAINRGALSDDPAIQAIITEELNVVGQRLIDKLVAEGRRRDVTEIVVEGEGGSADAWPRQSVDDARHICRSLRQGLGRRSRPSGRGDPSYCGGTADGFESLI
jgi:AcrR family transcriptional regulator